MPDLLAKLLLSLEPEADAEPRAWADALWLAAWQWHALGIAPVAAPPPVVEPEEPSGPDDPGPIGLQEADDRTNPPSPLPPSEPRAEVAETGDVANIHLPGSGVSTSAESGPAVRQVRLPAAAALPGRGLLSRRLYPLRRRIPSRTQFVLDESATVDQIANGDAWLPVLRPKAERWLTCTLLVDDSLSMVYWRRTAVELQRMLVGLGAFRRVTLVRWDGEKAEPRLAGGQGEHLVLVLTDTTSTAWRDGRWWQALNGWGRGHFVGILSALPEPMWDGTALHVAQPAQLRRSRATLTNSSLEAKERDWADPPLPAGLRLPVATLEPDPLGIMATLVADPRHPWMLGLVLPPPVEETKGEADPLTAAERVQRFYKTASRTARELAGLVAVAPVVSLHVLRLIRASLLPQARQVHETEVLLGGLLHAPRTPQELIPSEDQPLAFHDGVADLLLDAVPTPRWPAVLRTVSEFVDDSVGTTHGLLHSFRALLEAPRGEITPGNIEHPFLQLAVKRLMRLGGDYAACARKWRPPAISSAGRELQSSFDRLHKIEQQPIGTHLASTNEVLIEHHIEMPLTGIADQLRTEPLEFEMVARDETDVEKYEAERLARIHAAIHNSSIQAHSTSVIPGVEEIKPLKWELASEQAAIDELFQPPSLPSAIAITEATQPQERETPRVHLDIVEANRQIEVERYEAQRLDRIQFPIHELSKRLELSEAIVSSETTSLETSARLPADTEVSDSQPTPATIKNSIGMQLKNIPAGEFLMGSPDDEPGRFGYEGPQHRVRFSHAFHMGIFPVTQREFELVMGQCPAHFRNLPDSGNLPMESVSWNDAVQFCVELSLLPEERLARRVYRLPTEAEWEYACRGGTQTPFAFGSSLSSAQANVQGTKFGDASSIGQSREQTTAVGSFPANGFGLHDMHGNVGEWCADIFDAEYYLRSPEVDPKGPDVVQDLHTANLHPRVVRGGHWNSISSSNCRSARRGKALPDTKSQYDGFRVVMTYGDISEHTTDGSDQGIVGDSAPVVRALFRDAQQLARECQRRLEISMADGILDLGDLPLTVLPPGIRTATWLTVLALGDQKPCRNSGVLEWSSRRAQCVITDLRPLAALPNLLALDLGSCSDLGRLDPLADLKSLQFLNLHRCSKITDLQPLSGLVHLESLNLTLCESIVDLRPLGNLTALRTLRLRGCAQLAYMPQTKNFPNLSVLDLTGCDQLVSLSPLAPLMALEVLELTRCRRIANLGPLAGLTKLRSLDLSVCTLIADLSPLRSLTALQTLNLSGCGKIESIEPLSGMKQLQSLNLWDCKSVVDLEPLAHLEGLKDLDLRGCGKVTNLRPLSALRQLSSLDLQFTGSTEFAPILPLLSQLTSLRLHGTKFTDLDPVVLGVWNENVIEKVRRWLQRGKTRRIAGELRDDNSLQMKLVWCPPGTFLMGSPESEMGRFEDEAQASVTLSRGFWIGQTAITQGQWEMVMDSKPWLGKVNIREGAFLPATCIGHGDELTGADAFCKRLTVSEREAGRLDNRLAYRLPTEAEWEYACRAGTTTPYSYGSEDSSLGVHGWYAQNCIESDEKYPHQVALKKANDWGLFDMMGNTWECCADFYAGKLLGGVDPSGPASGLYRVLRGGSWSFSARYCRSASRGGHSVSTQSIGFRVVLDVISGENASVRNVVSSGSHLI